MQLNLFQKSFTFYYMIQSKKLYKNLYENVHKCSSLISVHLQCMTADFCQLEIEEFCILADNIT